MCCKELKLMIATAVLIIYIPALIGDVAQLVLTLRGDEPNIKIEPPVEVVKKFDTVVSSTPACPRTTPTSSDILGEENEYDHCKECQMGVYFKNKEEDLECSYCLKVRKA